MEAVFYEKRDDNKVQCVLCPNRCLIGDGKTGVCGIRGNHGGTLYADAYGEVVSLAIDPIEKKPLYHFHPSKPIVSTGPNGCNFHCGFCQNYGISQNVTVTKHIEPAELADLAGRNGSIGVAYTYTEPFVWFEYIRDAGALVHERGLVNVLVSNGYVNEEPLRELLPLIDAMNIDIKSMRPDFYQKVCGGKLDDVLRTVAIASGRCHIEVTNLIIPGYNDDDEDFIKLRDWIHDLKPTIPVHYSRYFPRHTFTAPETPRETLERALRITREKLPYVYAGNIDIKDGSDTHCPKCGTVLVARINYIVRKTGIENGACRTCGRPVDIVGD